ncbi:MAG: RagB/SusD family nutrient uptake outer membrane protein [Fermentimonas sp.]
MKAKQIKRIILISLLSILISCTDFLEKHPLDQVSGPTFWKTNEDVEMALTGVYSRLLTNTYNYLRMRWDVMAGDVGLHSDHAVRKISMGHLYPSTGDLVSYIYSQCYSGIAACNYFLDNIDRVTTLSESKMNQYKGEVLFLRALHYFTLSTFYGGVPIYTTSPTIEESKIKQSTKEEVVAQVLSDLEFAIANLPNIPYDGHAVKGSALSLKAKVLLYNERWSEAAQVAKQVIEGGVFGLYDDYPNLFLTAGQTNNVEIIFSTRYLNPNIYTVTSGYDVNYGYEANFCPTQWFVDQFECVDGLPITESPLYDPDNFKLNRDPRLGYTVRHKSEPMVNSSGYEGFGANPSVTGYFLKKYLEPENVPYSYAIRSDQDHVLLRYSDVLLMYAEAKNEADGPDESVYAAINKVRAREGVNMPPIPSGLNKDAMREKIRHERHVEFGLEGERYHDLKRWKIAEVVLNSLVEPHSGNPLVFKAPTHYLFPFPENEMDLNPNLVQNPGY